MKLNKHGKPVIKPMPDFSRAKPNNPAYYDKGWDKYDIIFAIVLTSVSVFAIVLTSVSVFAIVLTSVSVFAIVFTLCSLKY